MNADFATKIEVFKTKTDKEVLDYLFKFWELDSQADNGIFKVVASYQKAGTDKYGQDYGFFVDVRSLNGDILYYPFRLGQIRIYTRHNESYMREKLWQIGVKLSTRYDYRKTNPFALQLDRVMGLPKNSFVDRLEKEKLIRKIFDETGATERDARSISNALLSIMGDLYTETDERFIFELLQNADDQPKSDRQAVGVKIKTLSEHLLFMHNGKPFTSADVESISSIGDSTKKNDIEKTGYKGIGFKSVFSDADTVFINSGVFSFCFDKYSPLYKYDNVDAIPWQLKPIWEEKYRLPKEIVSDADYFTSPVSIALQVGVKKIQVYDSLIKKLISEPRFMLFLRHIGNLKFYPNGEDGFIEIKKVVADEKITIIADGNISEWILSDFELDIPEDVIDEMQTEKLIPIKLKQAKRTKLSFAVSVDNGEIHSTKNSILFTYLPTKVGDFKFPFLVNADFLTTASRESIHSKSVWNKFLFKTIGTLIVEWAILNKDQKGYLNLLLTKTLDIDNPLAEDFNSAYQSAIENKSFILNHNGELARQDEIILDKTGLSEIIGADLFCKIIGTDKCLPSYNIESKILSESIFKKIDKITVIIDSITNNELFNRWFVNSSDEKKTKLYNWIERKSLNSDRVPRIKKFVSYLPLFKFGNEYKSFNSVESEDDYIISTEKVVPIKAILEKLGLKCSVNLFVNHPLNVFIDLQDEGKLFTTIKKCDFSILDTDEKKTLFSVLKEFDKVGLTKLKEIALFRNLNGTFKPLSEMVVYNANCPLWLNDFVICKEDYSKELDDYLIKDENVFKDVVQNHISEFSTISPDELYEVYSAQWNYSFTQELIDRYGATEALLNIVERTDGAKKYFINKHGNVYLTDSTIKKSIEYRIVKMALDNNYDIKNIIFINGKNLSEYTISDDVTITINGKNYNFSLSDLLPKYQNTTGALNNVKNLLSDIVGYEKLFSCSPMDNKIIWNDIVKMQNQTLPQIAFLICYNVSLNWRYTFSYADDMFVKILNFCYDNQIDILSRYIRYFDNPKVAGLYVDAEEYTLTDERLSATIRQWADNDNKMKFLFSLGVKSDKTDEIKRRKSFVNNEQMYLGNLEKSEITTFLNWVKTLQTPFTGDNQIAILQEMFKRVGQDTQYDFNDYRLASEWDNDNYRQNIRNKIKIYCLPHQTPKRGIYDGVHLFTEYCGDNVYFTNYFSLYVDNSNNQIEQILLKVSDKGISPFTKDDWHKLFSVNRNDYEKLEQEKKELEREIEKLKQENNGLLSEVQNHGHYTGKDAIKEDDRISINRDARIAAKDYLLQFDDYDVSDWEPEESGQIVKDVVTYKGQPITVVVTSSRASKLYLHPRVFVELMQQPENLLLNYDGKDIHSLSFDNVFKDNPNVNLIFDADVITDDEFAKLASRYMYTRKTCFVIENPRYSIFDEIQSFGLEKTNEDIEVDTDFSDDDLFNF